MDAVWVHGNAVRAQWVGDPPIAQIESTRFDGSHGGVPWSDIVGLPTGPGQTFRCRDSGGGGLGARVVPPRLSTWFHVAIPTPVIRSNKRLSLLRVFVLWRASGPAALLAVSVFDGPNQVAVSGPDPRATPRDGSGGGADLIDGATRFAVTPPHPVFFGIEVSLGFGFEADLDLTFTAAGADFQ